MKKILTAILTLFFITPNAFAFSFFKSDDKKKVPNKIRTYIEKKSFEFEVQNEIKNEEKQIKELLNIMQEASNAHDIEAMKQIYDKNYISYDGFDYDTFIEMMTETFENYKDISYKSDVKNISIMGDEAVVTLVDYTKATIANDKPSKISSNDTSTGYLDGVCNYAIYLKKNHDEWKIVGDTVISEITSIKYGSAREAKMTLSAPLKTKKGEEYCIKFEMTPPKNTRAIAALGNETIVYPSNEPEEIFRKMPSEGILERIVHPNEKGLNEYAIASVGFTKIDLLEDLSAIRFEMTGLAFIMQRVNLYDEKNPKNEKKIEKKEVKASVGNEG